MKHRLLARRAALTILTVLMLTGCTTQRPLVSHAHVGHALTTWHDTPGREGLMTVAAADLEVAEREAQRACARPLAGAEHARNVLHALVPEATDGGSGSGYGALRALMGTIEHLEFAATSADASLNLVTAVAELSAHGESIHSRLEVAADLAQNLNSAPGADRADQCAQLQSELTVAIHGGVAGPEAGGFPSIGFNALHQSLTDALERESDPAYEPVPRRYVLGLVRLPSGRWEYQLARPSDDALVYYGNYGY